MCKLLSLLLSRCSTAAHSYIVHNSPMHNGLLRCFQALSLSLSLSPIFTLCRVVISLHQYTTTPHTPSVRTVRGPFTPPNIQKPPLHAPSPRSKYTPRSPPSLLLRSPTNHPDHRPLLLLLLPLPTRKTSGETHTELAAAAAMNVDERGAGGGGGPPHGLLLAAVAAVVVAAPFLLGDSGQAIVDAIPELLSPAGLLLLPLALILLIRFLSSDRGTALADVFFSPGTGPGPDSIHRVGGSPVGVALALLLIVVLLYYRISIFGDDDSGD